MKITSAEFVKSASILSESPDSDRPEYGFIGRSNVGKSSLINYLCQRDGLAKTSSTPGKTQLINHFNINDAWYLVDLPGYGYAKVPKKERFGFKKMIEDYCLERSNLCLLFVLIDSRHEPLAIDIEFVNWCGEQNVPIALVFTKSDKKSARNAKDNMKAFADKMTQVWEDLPPIFLTSATKKLGGKEILDLIGEINKQVLG